MNEVFLRIPYQFSDNLFGLCNGNACKNSAIVWLSMEEKLIKIWIQKI